VKMAISSSHSVSAERTFQFSRCHLHPNQNSKINNQQSTINNRQSTINNQQSTINNRQSAIGNPCSTHLQLIPTNRA